MAAVAIMITYFQVIINVSSETARNIIDQGTNDFDSLVEFTEADMKTICTTIRRPGGMIINRDPGHLISMVAEKCLLMTAYGEMHQARTSRPIESQSMTRAFIMYLAPLQEEELAYSEPRTIHKPLRDT